MNDPTSMTDAQLAEESAKFTKEVKRRAEMRRLAAEAEQDRLEVVLLKNIDLFLEFVPSHSRTSCSDDHLTNRFGSCVRCMLLAGKSDGFFPTGYRAVVVIETRRSVE